MTEVINEKLGAWLLENGNTREQLAELIGISRPALNSKISGKTKWSWEEVVRIASIVDCTLDELACKSEPVGA